MVLWCCGDMSEEVTRWQGKMRLSEAGGGKREEGKSKL